MKPRWSDAGLTKEGAELAEQIRHLVLRAYDECQSATILRAVCDQVVWEKEVLSTRTKAFQKMYARDNGEI